MMKGGINKIDVSIIIVSWNTRQITCNCIDSIYDQTNNLDFEIIIIDNASVDDSVVTIKRDYPEVILIENKENRGFATANNQGIEISQGRYILLLNSDTIILDNAIAKTVEFADKHPKAAVVGCKALNPDMILQPTCFMFPSLLNMVLSTTYMYKLFPRNRFFGRERMSWWDRNDVRELDVVTGCFMLVREKAIEEIGLMDEHFFMYGEETDWCYRFKKADWKMLFTPDAEIIHLGGRSTAQISEKMLIELRLSILKFIKKHHGWLKHKVACFLTIMFFAIRIPVWLAIATINGKKRKQALERSRIYLTGMRRVFFYRRRVLVKQS